MRYDDRIDTVLAWPLGDAAARDRAWTQLIDLIADGAEAAVLMRAITAAQGLRRQISHERRRSSAERAAKSRVSAALIGFFAEEPDIARPLLAAAVLPQAEWAALLPQLDHRARAILTARRDLPAAIAEALTPPTSQIVDLLSRIDAFQNARPDPMPPVQGFAFTVDGDGHFLDSDGRPLGPRLGADARGVDGQAIGAWRARMAMADARLEIDAGELAGVWRISASPIVDKAGVLLGYRGVARVPRADEVAAPVEPLAIDAGTDGFLRAIEQLRDPLDALVIADLPDGDAVAVAREVSEQGQALADAIGRFEEMAIRAHGAPFDMAAVLERLHGALSPLAEARGLVLDFRIPRDLPPADVEPEALERMVTRLVTSVVPLGFRRERIVARLARDRQQRRCVTLTITRPGRLVGCSAEQLRDPDSQDAAMLALGFALRLVEKLADQAGGALTIADDRLILSLPARAGQARAGAVIAQ